VIAELSFVSRCRELGRRELVWEEWPFRHEMPPKTPRASLRWPRRCLDCLPALTGVARNNFSLVGEYHCLFLVERVISTCRGDSIRQWIGS
jgi:hypothetical protein